jgi:glycine/D-amino acid oxidase-like deaminating enzyme/nitrite reductase/ring-hydroxylating ferredoxin subunit
MSDRSSVGSPARAISLWVDTAPATTYPALQDEVDVDFAVIGGGIAGLTAALLLKRGGAQVAVVEAGRVGTGVTGHTTGKVSSLHRLVYRELRRNFGEDGARTYGAANQAAIERVTALVEEEAIDCDFRRVDNFTYAESQLALEQVKAEASVAQGIGLPATFTDSVPLPFGVRGAVRFTGQAQLHATKYLLGLARAVAGEGNHVFEETHATGVSGGERCVISTDEGSIRAKAAILATNLPFIDRGLFFARCHMHRSYLVAVGVDDGLPDGTFISADDPLRSLMPHRGDGREVLLVGGEGHRPSERVDPGERYARLERWASARFPVSSFEYRWSTEDALPVDGVPYIGRMTPLSRNLYVATGFRKWGLSNGTVAGEILADRLLGRPNRRAELFDSNRVTPRASARRFVTENLRTGARLVRGRLSRPDPSLPDLTRGTGQVVEVGGESIAAYKDERAEIHALSAVCTHAGCIVDWNSAERTWDCPCHGSRFDRSGRVLQGPAVEELAARSVD